MNSPSPNRMLFHRQTYPHGSQPVDLWAKLPRIDAGVVLLNWWRRIWRRV